jgi:hypothetical protein
MKSQARKQRESRWQAELSLPPVFTLVSCSAYSMTLKEPKCSSEKYIDFKGAARSYIPEDCTPHNQRCENLKTYISFLAQNPSVELRNIKLMNKFATHHSYPS